MCFLVYGLLGNWMCFWFIWMILITARWQGILGGVKKLSESGTCSNLQQSLYSQSNCKIAMNYEWISWEALWNNNRIISNIDFLPVAFLMLSRLFEILRSTHELKKYSWEQKKCSCFGLICGSSQMTIHYQTMDQCWR